jgi:hypothetical protein
MIRLISLVFALSLFIPAASGKKNAINNIESTKYNDENPALGQQEDEISGNNSSGYGDNIISISPIIFNNSGLGFGISYERTLTANGKWSLFVPLIYNSNNKESYGESYRDRSIGVFAGFRFYPTSSKGSVRYSIGGLLGNYTVQRKYSHIARLGGSYDTDKTMSYNKAGILIDNALLCTVSRKLTIGINLGLGVAGSGEDNYDASVPFVLTMFQLGYRF